jgi:hypothetical protein
LKTTACNLERTRAWQARHAVAFDPQGDTQAVGDLVAAEPVGDQQEELILAPADALDRLPVVDAIASALREALRLARYRAAVDAYAEHEPEP